MSTPGHPDTGQYAPVPPPVAPGDVPADTSMWTGTRDPADNWGVTYSEPLPSSEGSNPHWQEMTGAQ